MIGYAKYAFTPQTRPWYEKGCFCFFHFYYDFRSKCLGMPSMRLPPKHARGMKRAISVFLIFFLISLQNVWVCKVCAYRLWYEQYVSV